MLENLKDQIFQFYDRNIRRPIIRWALRTLQHEIHSTALEKGWWDKLRNEGEIIALIHSEATEALEAVRNNHPDSRKIPYQEVEEELADIAIRLMDYAEHKQYRLPESILSKLDYNQSRSYRHGNKQL